MKVMQKRFQYWGSLNGEPQIMWSNWFNCNNNRESVQLKGFRGNELLNEYRSKC